MSDLARLRIWDDQAIRGAQDTAAAHRDLTAWLGM